MIKLSRSCQNQLSGKSIYLLENDLIMSQKVKNLFDN